VKKRAAFKWKDAISGFPVSSGSAEALVRCGGKIKNSLIAHFLGNICAKNCRNRTVYVKITASCKGGTFLRHSVYDSRSEMVTFSKQVRSFCYWTGKLIFANFLYTCKWSLIRGYRQIVYSDSRQWWTNLKLNHVFKSHNLLARDFKSVIAKSEISNLKSRLLQISN